ncbi:MAG: DMT family transporter [Desulfarculus sp.]|nr:DMT family transporter [Desulfarculus sp.]
MNLGRRWPAPASGAWPVMAGASMISFSAVFVKLALVGPTTAGFYRMLFGGLLLAGLLLASRQPLRIERRHLVSCLACAVFFALDLSFWHRCIHLLGPGLATILSNFQVFFLAGFGAAFLGERLCARLLLAIPLAMAGLFLLVGLHKGGLGREYVAGLVYGLLTALAYAAYIITLRRLQHEQPAAAATAHVTIISLICAAILGVEALLQGESLAITDLRSLAALTGYGLCGQVLGWALISRGLPRTPASLGGLLLLLQPTLAFIWDMLFFARATDGLELAGAGLTLAAIYLGAGGGRAQAPDQPRAGPRA